MLKVEYSEAKDLEDDIFCVELVVNTDDEAVLKKLRRMTKELFGSDGHLIPVPKKEG